LNHRTVIAPVNGCTAFTLSRSTLVGLVTGTVDLGRAIADGTVTVDGDPAVLGRLVALLAPVDPDFAVVTP
jgi:alkyl sulfatase BDS1-like metallo-beta-lactamase superfamily hydrolase